MTHDNNLTVSSRPAFLSMLVAFDASVISFFVLWSNADAEAVSRTGEHGLDPDQLLSHATPFWFAAHTSLLNLLALDVLAFLARRRSHSQPE